MGVWHSHLFRSSLLPERNKAALNIQPAHGSQTLDIQANTSEKLVFRVCFSRSRYQTSGGVKGCIGKYQNHFVTTVPIKPGLSCGRSQLQRILQRPFQHPIGRQRFKPKKQQRKSQVEYFGSVVVLWYCTSLQIGFKHDACDGILFVSVGRLQFLTNDHLK